MSTVCVIHLNRVKEVLVERKVGGGREGMSGEKSVRGEGYEWRGEREGALRGSTRGRRRDYEGEGVVGRSLRGEG